MDPVTRVWQRLAEAVAAAAQPDPMRHVVLCTEGGHGRVVVLREVNTTEHLLHFFSDVRAAKLQQLGNTEAVVYDPEQQLQVRARGILAASESGPEVDLAWAKLGSHSRKNYRGLLAPGSKVSAAEKCAQLAEHDGRIHFCRLTLRVHQLDALWLQELQRYRVSAKKSDGGWDGAWVQL